MLGHAVDTLVVWLNHNSGLFVALSLVGTAIYGFHVRVVRPALADFHLFATDLGEIRRVLKLELLPHPSSEEREEGESTLREDLLSIAKASIQHSDALKEVIQQLAGGSDRFRQLDEGQARLQLEVGNLREALKDRDERLDVLHTQVQQFAAQLSAISTVAHIGEAP